MRPILTLFLSLALLGACGDDGGGPVTPPAPNAAVQPATSPPPTPPPPDPATETPFAVRGFVVAVDGPRGGNIGIWGAVVTAEDRDTGQIAGSGFSDNSGAYAITGLRGDHYILRVLPPPGYRPPPPQHIARPSAGADAEDVDFSLRYDIPELDDRFDRQFWNELLFDAYDCPTPADCPAWYTSGRAIEELSDRYLRIQANPSPSFYVVTSGFTAAEVASIKAQLPSTVVTLTGDFYYGTIESGPEDRDEIEGWVTIRQGAPEGDEIWCGRAYVGVSAGQITIDPDRPDECPLLPVLRHEVGHAMGLFHVSSGGLMTRSGSYEYFGADEIYHSRLAYQHWRFMQYREGPQMPAPPTEAFDPTLGSYVITCDPR